MIRRASFLLAGALVVLAPAGKALFVPDDIEDGLGRASRPAYSAEGKLVWLERTSGGVIRLVSSSPGNPETTSITTLDASAAFDHPQIGLDRRGQIWIAAVRRTAEGGRIVYGESAGILEELETGPGTSDGPDLGFDARNGPWLAWRRISTGGESILVRDIATSRTWTLTRTGDRALSFPRLVQGGEGRIWVVWSGKDRLGYGVFARFFDGLSWSAGRRLAATGERPCLAPDAGVDLHGRLWAAWSAYDGSDYEIYLGRVDGGFVSPPAALTADEAAADEFPALAFWEGHNPVVAWTRTDETGSKVMASLFDEDFVFEPVDVGSVSFRDGLDVPRLAAEGGRLAVLLAGEKGRDIRALTEADLKRLPSRRREPVSGLRSPSPSAPAIIFNPNLSEKTYVCFGDSITYGHLAGQNDPTVGYPPQLEARLDAAFGPTDIWNDGFPGEFTSQGLVRFEALVAGRKTRYFLILEGTNDVKESLLPIETTIFNLKEMLRKALAYGAFPAIATVIPRRDWVWYFQEYVDRHNALVAGIKQMAADLKVPVLDLNQEFNAYPGGPEALLDIDGKHPNAKGYQFMAERWFEAIGKFPFPAADIQAQKKYDKILFFRLPGNMLSWKASPKTIAPAVVQGYKIYRRRQGEGVDKFSLLLLATGSTFSYFDTALQGADVYEYVMATLRTDGVEGPCSELVRPR